MWQPFWVHLLILVNKTFIPKECIYRFFLVYFDTKRYTRAIYKLGFDLLGKTTVIALFQILSRTYLIVFRGIEINM